MSDIPPWLDVMRAITGLSEDTDPGESNPRIVGMAAFIGRKFPAQASYAAGYTSDDIAWCGVATDFCLAACTPAGISGPFGPTDTDRWMWAQSFADDEGFVHMESPVPGAIVVMTRSGGGHVTMFEEWDGDMLRCRGGNQSNEVNVSSYDPDTVIAYVWPKEWPMPPVPPAPRENLEKGDSGPQVAQVQTTLGIVPTDGDFGSITEGGVKGYQRACSISADGEVGPTTWGKLDELDAKVAKGSEGLPPELVSAIIDAAKNSTIASYSWKDRGKAPIGYIEGMALSFALALERLNAEDDAMWEAAKPNTGDGDKDVFAWYKDEFKARGMDNSDKADGADRLLHLYSLMIGLGMRESSGRYCEGRDTTATNTSADTAEAGMFQTSWNIRSCSSQIPPLLNEFWLNPMGFRETFQDGVSPDSNDLDNYGSGGGAQYQFLSKYAPFFHAAVSSIGLRNLRQHWGPINRKEAELRSEAASMLMAVQNLVENAEPVPPDPGPDPDPDPTPELPVLTVTIDPPGSARVVIIGGAPDGVA
jgi:uncharacterized protein (TIGR02594 family)